MKHFLFVISLAVIFFSCENSPEPHLPDFSPLTGLSVNINGSALKLLKSEDKNGRMELTYSDNANLKFNLIITTIDTASVKAYVVSLDTKNVSWNRSDTLKILFNSADSIANGLYSKPYPPVYSWCKPINFKNFSQIDTSSGIQNAYWKCSNSSYAMMLPLGGKGLQFTLGQQGGLFGAVGFSQAKVEINGMVPVMVVSASKDIYDLISCTAKIGAKSEGTSANLREHKHKPDMFRYLGWATWNAFKLDVNVDNLTKAAISFKENKIPVKWVLIDDGWLDQTNNELNSFEPLKSKFPDGFKPLITSLQIDYGIMNVGVWHTLNGYWCGLNPNSRFWDQFNDSITYNDRIVWLNPTTRTMKFVNPFGKNGLDFYDKWYTYLKDQGISFVKVDNQLCVKKISDNNFPLWNTGDAMMQNLHTAVNSYFHGNVINCMNMDNSVYSHYRSLPVARCVEDYNPENNKNLYDFTYMQNAAGHVLASIHNSVWMSQYVWSDFDMFQSNHNDSWYYALAKVMSAGPVYITDEPDKHNKELLTAITLHDGTVIQAEKPALPAEECMFQLFSGKQPFKVFSAYDSTGLIAVWNVSDADSVNGSFSLKDIPLLQETDYLVFDYFNRNVRRIHKDESIPLNLERMACKLFNLVPIDGNTIVIGNINKIIPQAGISDLKITAGLVEFKSIDSGTINIYSEYKPNKILINKQPLVNFSYTANIVSFRVTENNSVIQVQF